ATATSAAETPPAVQCKGTPHHKRARRKEGANADRLGHKGESRLLPQTGSGSDNVAAQRELPTAHLRLASLMRGGPQPCGSSVITPDELRRTEDNHMYQRASHSQTRRLAAAVAGVFALALSASAARADTAKCISTISKATAKYEIAVQKALGKCED